MRILIIGASKGLGKAFAEGIPENNDELILVSRTEPQALISSAKKIEWIKADAANIVFAKEVKTKILDRKIDLLIYNSGIWETDRFSNTPSKDIDKIITVNLTSAIKLINELYQNIINSDKKTVVLIGSTAGLENEGANSVAYCASKFGLRGLAHSLREDFREKGGKVTVISPGSIASDLELNLGTKKVLETYNRKRMPVEDLVNTIKYVMNLSEASLAKEIIIPAFLDDDV